MKKIILIILLTFFYAVFADSVFAATYYVSTSGNDSNNGTQSSPWRTIQKAANTLNSGETVIVSTGTYNETVSVSRSGINFVANGSVNMEGFYITGNNTVVTGFTVNDTPSYGIELKGSNSTLKNNTITKGRNSGLFIAGQNNLIENNDISKIIQPKPHSSGGDANCVTFFGSGHVFRGNYCHDIYSDGTLVTDAHIDGFQTWDWTSQGGVGHDILFEKNVMMYPKNGKIWNIEDGAYNITIKNNITLSRLISLFTYTDNLSLINNTFVGTGSGADGHHVRQTTVNASNNIYAYFQGSHGDFENLESSSTITGSHNCYYQSDRDRPADPGDIIGQNPLFINESQYNFNLQANSPCAGMGAESSGAGTPPAPIPSPSASTAAPSASTSVYPGLSWWPAAVNPNLGDQINYQFSLPQSGNYIIKAMVNAPTDGDNSFLLYIDQVPQEPAQVWDIISLTSGFEERTVSLRGNGTFSQDEFTPKVFALNQGVHTLHIIGREPGTQLSQLKLELYATVDPACVCSSNNTCSDACTFDKFTDLSYSNPIKCNQDSNVLASIPTADQKNNWCRSTLRTKGDVDGKNGVNNMDYFYYVQAVNGGKIPSSVNLDADGDGVISTFDRSIIMRSQPAN